VQGFHCGHSAAAFLLAHEDVRMYSFDTASHSYTTRCAETLARLFPQRFELVIGDSRSQDCSRHTLTALL
jgi:hypothetical protein